MNKQEIKGKQSALTVGTYKPNENSEARMKLALAERELEILKSRVNPSV